MTTAALARREIPWTPEQSRLVKQTLLKPKNREATDDELLLFAYQCSRTGLDPFTKQIYGIYRWDKRLKREALQVQVAIDGLRLIAERTGKYLGQTGVEWADADGEWTDLWTVTDAHPFAARVGVYKAGIEHATVATAKFKSYAQTYEGNLTGLWKQMPEQMIAKCAEALALRKAFPNETSGLYIPEEMEQADATAEAERAAQPEGRLEQALAEAPEEKRQSRSPKAAELDQQIRKMCVELDGERLGGNKAGAYIRGARTLADKRGVVERLSGELDRRAA